MSSTLKIAAARANGAKSRGPITEEGKRAAAANSRKSTGPVTPEGKSHSARNAIRHGILADSIVVDGESDPRFCATIAALQDEFEPHTESETILLDALATAHWRRMRVWSLEKAAFREETQRRLAAQGFAPGEDDGESPITQLARSFRSLADGSNTLQLLNRYETRFSHEFYRALSTLTARAEKRKLEDEGPAAENGGHPVELSLLSTEFPNEVNPK